MQSFPLGMDDAGWSELDEPELIELARRDPAAFGELYRRYHARVYRYLLTYADVPVDTADLTQHVFLRVLEALPTYEQRGLPFSSWLFRIARNAVLDAYRRRRRVLPWEHLPEALHPVSTDDPEALSLRNETLNQLRVLIGQLDAQKQELLALRFAAGLTVVEIAAVMRKSEAAVWKQLARTLESLEERFDDD